MYYHYGKWVSLVLFLEVTDVLSLWEVGVPCPLFGGNRCTITMGSGVPCPLLGGNRCTITMGSGVPCPLLGGNRCTITMHGKWVSLVLFLEVTDVLSL